MLPMRHRDGAAATGQAHSLGCFSDRELCTCGTLRASASWPSTFAKTSDIGEPCLSYPIVPGDHLVKVTNRALAVAGSNPFSISWG